MVHAKAVKKTVADRLSEFGDAARKRWYPHFERAGSKYPPERILIAVFKEEKVLQVYSAGKETNFIRSIPVLAASGVAGPKLREGDQQVPEGLYKIEMLNPNSLFHVSLRLNYPNDSDRSRAAKETRTTLGGDIMIHGKDVSIGCVAVGDEAAEDLFTLAADAGLPQIDVIIAPVDWRAGRQVKVSQSMPPWTDELYADLRSVVRSLPPQ